MTLLKAFLPAIALFALTACGELVAPPQNGGFGPVKTSEGYMDPHTQNTANWDPVPYGQPQPTTYSQPAYTPPPSTVVQPQYVQAPPPGYYMAPQYAQPAYVQPQPGVQPQYYAAPYYPQAPQPVPVVVPAQ